MCKYIYILCILTITLVYMGCFLPEKHRLTPHISGQLVKQSNQEPIEGARVYFKDLPDTEVKTDKNGFFEIPPYYVTFTCILGPCDFIPRCFDFIINTDNQESIIFTDIGLPNHCYGQLPAIIEVPNIHEQATSVTTGNPRGN